VFSYLSEINSSQLVDMSTLAHQNHVGFDNNFPFSFLNNVELENLNCSDTINFLESLPNLEIVNEVSQFSNLPSADIDLNMAFQADCKYYSVSEYQKLRNKKQFNLFHSNTNSLEAKFENLHEFISSTFNKFDILAITETSQKSNQNFKLNIKIQGYDFYSTPSNTNKGGSALYVDSNYNSFERVGLNIQHGLRSIIKKART